MQKEFTHFMRCYNDAKLKTFLYATQDYLLSLVARIPMVVYGYFFLRQRGNSIVSVCPLFYAKSIQTTFTKPSRIVNYCYVKNPLNCGLDPTQNNFKFLADAPTSQYIIQYWMDIFRNTKSRVL